MLRIAREHCHCVVLASAWWLVGDVGNLHFSNIETADDRAGLHYVCIVQNTELRSLMQGDDQKIEPVPLPGRKDTAAAASAAAAAAAPFHTDPPRIRPGWRRPAIRLDYVFMPLPTRARSGKNKSRYGSFLFRSSLLLPTFFFTPSLFSSSFLSLPFSLLFSQK